MAFAVLQYHSPQRVEYIAASLLPLLDTVIPRADTMARLARPGGLLVYVQATASMTDPGIYYCKGYYPDQIAEARKFVRQFNHWQDETSYEFNTGDGVTQSMPVIATDNREQRCPDYAILEPYTAERATYLSFDLAADAYATETPAQVLTRITVPRGYLVKVIRCYSDETEGHVRVFAFAELIDAQRLLHTYASYYDYADCEYMGYDREVKALTWASQPKARHYSRHWKQVIA